MRFSLPFVYNATVLHRRARNYTPATFGTHAEVEIREIASDDAPVALRWQAAEDFQGWWPEEDACMTRWDGESHWHPLLVGSFDGARIMRHADPAAWESAMSGGARLFLSSSFGAAAPGFHHSSNLDAFARGDVVPIEQISPKAVSWTAMYETAERLQEECGRLAVIDGLMWMRGKEPRYCAFPGRDAVKIRVSVSEPTPIIREDFFSLDRYDDMLDHLRSVFPGKEIAACPPAEVVLPQSLSSDDDAVSLVSAAESLVRHGHGLTRDAPLDKAICWFDLRDACAACVRDDIGHDGLADLVEKFAEAFGDDDHVASTAAAALDRWRLRPVRQDDGFSP